MKRLIFLIFGFIILSCNNERIIQLPEIENAEITEVLDVSPAYIFYDEKQPDSTLFNRKNLIGTTNWLVNVDKRLTLRQTMPHIQFLQNKRKKASIHKNENAKNYFTCNDTSIGNLGFVEFTSTSFKKENPELILVSKELSHAYFLIRCSHKMKLSISEIDKDAKAEVIQDLYFNDLKFFEEHLLGQNNKTILLTLDNDMLFQDYIALKNFLKPYKHRISNNEFIY